MSSPSLAFSGGRCAGCPGGFHGSSPTRPRFVSAGADVLFSPLFTALFHEPDLRHVAVAYDFQELSHPKFFDLGERARREAFRADLGRADRVVAISEATKKDAIERAGIPPERVTVIPPVVGAPRTPLRPEEMEQRLAAQGLAAAGFTLYPANFWPHKNHERLLAAFALARTKLPDMCLVLCGALDAARERLLSSVEARGLVDAVRVFPYVSDGDVTALLQGARFLVFPSLYEGFGIPVLEAMALGTPAACSDLPALRELAGEDAVYFDPADETSIADALSLLWTSEETRRNLSVGGLAHAARLRRARRGRRVPPAAGVLTRRCRIGSLSSADRRRVAGELKALLFQTGLRSPAARAPNSILSMSRA